MTTPHERFRALCGFNDLLDLAMWSDSIPQHLREAATALRVSYPAAPALRALAESGRQGLPADAAYAFDRAAAWLYELGRSRPVSSELLGWWKWTDRHFPSTLDICDQLDAAGHPTSFLHPSIDAWIQPEP